MPDSVSRPLADSLRDRAQALDWGAAERTKHPRRKVAVVTCMDSRIDVFERLGLTLGDAHVVRNAGALVTDDVVRSLVLSQRALGTTEIVVMGHTDCGLSGLDDDAFIESLEAQVGERPQWRPGGFADVAAQVQRGVGRLRDCPFLARRDAVSGFVLDVATGEVREVASS